MLIALLILATACGKEETPQQECQQNCYFAVQYAERIGDTVYLYLDTPCGFESVYKSSEAFELVNYDRFNLNVIAICKDDLDALGYEL